MPHLKECLASMNEQNARYLELVSTVLYFDNLPKTEVVEKINKVKAKRRYTEEEIDQAYEYIEELKKIAKPN